MHSSYIERERHKHMHITYTISVHNISQRKLLIYVLKQRPGWKEHNLHLIIMDECAYHVVLLTVFFLCVLFFRLHAVKPYEFVYSILCLCVLVLR